MFYSDVCEKIKTIKFVKISAELLNADISLFNDIPLESYAPEDMLNDITEKWYGDEESLKLDCEYDEESGEFLNYSGMYVFTFKHPLIQKFYSLYNPQKEEEFFKYNDPAEDILQKSFRCFTNNLFIDYLDQEGNCTMGKDRYVGQFAAIQYTFDSFDYPFDFIELLYEYVNCLEKGIKTLAHQEKNNEVLSS
jgi:hypothetical protein